ncbi:enoyl-CoA hydratase/isomerase family protein [Pseudonocardia sp. RS010]|uniref:enoyl-CoA hydratase/isomerase family protein n=1 Tax=Pseudonocardia sp. RS010 TaxID=3385979 RepID=UPI0039A03A3F
MTAPVLVDHRGGVSWITLNRPAQLNPLSLGLMTELSDMLDDVAKDPSCRVVVVTGAGRAFSAGGDLDDFRGSLDAGRHDLVTDSIAFASATLTKLERLPQPVIAAVNGIAVAGGLEMILCCDLVVAAAGTRIGDGHLRYGVLPGGGGAVRSMHRLPPAAAKELLLTGGLTTAEQMHAWGLVNRVVPGPELVAAVEELAGRLARLSPLALAHVKRVANAALDRCVDDALVLEQEAFGEYVRSHDFREGVTAFAEKREPVFRGE